MESAAEKETVEFDAGEKTGLTEETTAGTEETDAGKTQEEAAGGADEEETDEDTEATDAEATDAEATDAEVTDAEVTDTEATNTEVNDAGETDTEEVTGGESEGIPTEGFNKKLYSVEPMSDSGLNIITSDLVYSYYDVEGVLHVVGGKEANFTYSAYLDYESELKHGEKYDYIYHS